MTPRSEEKGAALPPLGARKGMPRENEGEKWGNLVLIQGKKHSTKRKEKESFFDAGRNTAAAKGSRNVGG